MATPQPVPAAPSQPAWEITVTRLTQALQPRLEACAQTLLRRFQGIGLRGDVQVRQTPRGHSTFLALVGQRGLIGIVDISLLDGMALGQEAYLALDVRLLDACGDVVMAGLAQRESLHSAAELANSDAFSPESLDRAVTAIFVASLAQFDLQLRPPVPQS